jgi:polyhydroxyalkanoate synthase
MQPHLLSQFDGYTTWPGFVFEQLDQTRRWQGKLFDWVGWGAQETPFRVALTEPGLILRAYGDSQAAGPVLLIVAAPLKHAHIWDLDPETSVVRRCLNGGLRVYLLQWQRPGWRERGLGLADYADRFILDCLHTIEAETGQSQVFLAGHSLGGTFVALFAALYPERVKGLILLGAPVHFGPEAGLLGELAAVAPRAPGITALIGNMPGSIISTAGFIAAPVAFGWERWLDWLACLGDVRAMRTYLRVERWACEETPIAQRLFEEVLELLCREDRFMRGTLKIGDKPAAPAQVTAPLLSVIDPRCRLTPPAAVLPFHQAVSSGETKLLEYQGDTGVSVQHVGMLVGQEAHRRLWPEVIGWMHTHWARVV